jgi:hypothetical protein
MTEKKKLVSKFSMILPEAVRSFPGQQRAAAQMADSRDS